MSSVNLATAWVDIVPEVRGIASQMSRQLRPAQTIATTAGRESGNRFSGAFRNATSSIGRGLATALKYGAAGAAVGIGAAGAVGLKTAAQLETAKIGFTTMLGSGKEAEKFLGRLSKFAATTPFDLPGLQESASQLVAIGIKSKDVIPIMTTIGNITSGMGTGAEGVQRATRAIQQMNAAGKITAEDLNQLRDAGVPVYDLLTKATGKSTKQISEMRDAGELGRKELDALMELLKSGKGLERFNGLMDKQSQSLAGLWSTAKDTFSVGMAGAIEPLIPLIKDGLAGATELLADEILPKVQSGLAAVVKWGKQLDFSSFTAFMDSLAGSGSGESVSKIGSAFKDMWPAVQKLVESLPSFSDVLTVTAGVMGFLADHMDKIIQFLPLIVAGFVAYKVAAMGLHALEQLRLPITIAQTVANMRLAASQRALIASQASMTTTTKANTVATATNNTTQRAGIAARAKAAIATGVQRVKLIATTVATKAATVAQKALNWAMKMNPIGLIIIAITALVGAIVWLYNNNKTAKRIIDAAWKGIKNAVKWAWEKVIKPAFKAMWGFVKKYLIPIIEWLWNKVVKPAFKKIGSAIAWAWKNVIKPAFKAIWGFIKDDLIPWFQKLWHKVKLVWYNIRKAIKRAWVEYIKPVFDTLKKAVGKVPEAFEKAKDGIGKAWDKLKSIAKAPVRFVVNRVINDGLIGTFNKIPGVDLPKIKLPKGFAKGGLAPKGWAMVGEEGPELVNFSNPGRVYTAKQTSAALKHEDGHAAVSNTIAGGGFGAIWGPFQDAIRRAGKLFVGGGAGPAWQIGQAASMWDRLAGLRVRGGSGYPQASTSVGGLPSWMLAWATGAGNITFNTQGMAPGLSPQMKRATAAHEIGHVLGLPHTGAASIMQPVMGKYMQPTAYDKRRLESLYGEGSRKPGGPVKPANPFLGLVDKLVDAIRDRFPAGGMFIDAAVGLAKAGINKVTDWVGDLAKNIGSKIAGVAGDVVDGIKGFFGFAATAPGTLYDNGGRVGTGTTLVDNQSRKPEALLNARQWSTAHRAIQHVEQQANGAQFPSVVRLVVGDREFDAYVDTRAVAATGGALNSADNRLRFGGKYVGGLV